MSPTRPIHPILFITSAALLAVMFFVTDGVEGRTITVDDDGGADYEKIQDALDNATDGDTVRVWEGRYEENVTVDKSIDLIGNGSEETIIDGRGNEVIITADWVNMSGFNMSKGGNYGFIYLKDSTGCKITNNDCLIYLRDSSNCKITNNTCENNGAGIYLSDSSDCTFTNNTMDENSLSISGISLENWNTHSIDTSNTVNGKPVYYYKNVSGFTVPYGAGQVILANCTWITVENQNCSNGTVGIYVGYSSNITVKNNICSENNDNGIYLRDSGECTIENNTCEKNDDGIYLRDSSECIIENNKCSNNDDGIYLHSLSNCAIENNICSANNWYGIDLDSSIDCTISNNTCENNDDGIFLHHSSACTLDNNTCSNNEGYGISGGSGSTFENNTCENNDYGIFLHGSDDCKITNNTCSFNNDGGIYLLGSDDNTLTHNTISENRVGIYLYLSSRDNTAHYNDIYNNTEYGIDGADIYASDNDGCHIDARFNWWGHESGPYHRTKNPDGKGDKVTKSVKFSPWLDENGTLQYSEETNTDDFTILGMNGCVFFGLLGVLLLILLPTSREKGKPPVEKEESGGVDEGSKG